MARIEITVKGIGRQVGFIDKTGREVVPPKYTYAGDFSGGLAMVCIGNKYGFIDKTGKEVVPLVYDSAFSFSEGVGVVRIGSSTTGKYGLVDKTGREITPIKYSRIFEPVEGMARVVISGSYGFVDMTGNEIMLEKYIEVFDFSEGMARVSIGDSYNRQFGFVDKAGKEVVPLKYRSAEDFSEGFALVLLDNSGSRKYGFIDKTGNEIVPCKYQSATSFSEGMAAVQLNNKWGFIKKTTDPSSWAAIDVGRAITLNLVPEIYQDEYTAPMTRAEFCALGVRLYETLLSTEISERTVFSDTSDANVEKLAGIGVINGVGNNKFNPTGALNREQAATILDRLMAALGTPMTSAQPDFADKAIVSSWAKDSVGKVQHYQIMNGVGSNNFAPQQTYTREQCIITILRTYDVYSSMKNVR